MQHEVFEEGRMLLEAEVFICTEVKQKMSLDIYGVNTYAHTGQTIISF